MLARARLVALGLGVTGIGLVGLSRLDSTARAIEDASRQIQPGASLDLSSVVTSDWDRVVIIGPYTSQEDINDSLGFSWDSSKTGIAENDGICLLAFARANEVVDWASVRRSAADFCPPSSDYDYDDVVDRGRRFV